MKLKLLSETESLERLLGRFPENHSYRKFLEVELYRSTAGKRGEERIKKKFKEFYVDEEFHLLMNISLSIGDWKVQMDGLLITERCAIIIESKNINGKIHFDEVTGEFYRFNDNGEKTVMEDPTMQLNKHIRFLAIWLKTRKINIPIDGLVVFTPKQCEFISKPRDKHICKTYQMIDYLHKILQEYPQKMASPKLTKIRRTIENNQDPYQPIPLCEYYRIRKEELKTGVFCLECRLYTMQRHKRSWHCSECGQKNHQAHYLTIQEYFSIISTSLNNQQFRQFSNVTSPSVTTRLLGQFDLDAIGDLKVRRYRMKK